MYKVSTEIGSFAWIVGEHKAVELVAKSVAEKAGYLFLKLFLEKIQSKSHVRSRFR